MPIIKLTNTLIFTLGLSVSYSSFAQNQAHHSLEITIRPNQSFIKAKDRISLSDNSVQQKEFRFLLHKNLIVVSPAELKPIEKLSENLQGIADKLDIPLHQYVIPLTDGQKQLTISYRGRISHQPAQTDEVSTKSLGQTSGIIDKKGIFLAKSTAWYPLTENALLTFSAQIELPPEWDVVSQGKRTQHTIKDKHRVVRWKESQPQDDIYLVGGQYTQYTQSSGAALAMVYLRSEDSALAKKYLDATTQYISMYSQLLGPYPYSKFALVENFWETGYGMPSFTLLGPKVIRFPFIIYSSFPHEILHNWWGNSVYVDYATGNWAEGLTAYLADHLIKEQRGQGLKYRRSVLQKYTDYVSQGRDFPLIEFKSRHSSASEAIGYGKTLMIFHMLRTQLGDEKFIRALQIFYRTFKFKSASFKDIEHIFSQAAEQDLSKFVNQWVTRSGAPELRVSRAFSQPTNTGYRMTAVLEQFQSGEAYQLFIPIAIQIEGKEYAAQNTMLMNSKFLEISLNLPSRPIRLDIDPEFDLFRRLDNSEIPASLSQGFGAESVLIVLPKGADNPLLDAYHKLARKWQSNQQGKWDIVFDSEINALPKDKTVWLLGWKNRFRDKLANAAEKHQVRLEDDNVELNKDAYTRLNHSFVISARNPANTSKTLLWLATDNKEAIAGLARKLPHYRSYSYLVFSGDEPSNQAKGQWAVLDSPMTIAIRQTDNKGIQDQETKLRHRVALAQPAVVFSETRMLADVKYLANKARLGRGLGTKGLEEAANYIARAFRSAGLKPGGDHIEANNNTQDTQADYFQHWRKNFGEPAKELELKNVIGIIPGKNPKFEGESLIISAHYDHLGQGWPNAHAGDEGKIHPGADDNASGVAVMLELARLIAKKWQPERSIVFIAFTGEEADHAGSIHYTKNSAQFPIDKIIAVLNLDTVGRLYDNPLTILGTGSAREWVHIFRGAGFVTGINVSPEADDFGGSDQKSFLALGVPAVQFFGTSHSDIHRPGDTINKIDTAGMVKTASILKEAAKYLANREQPLNVTLSNIDKVKAMSAYPQPSGRRISVGTVPDFSFQGQGVKISSVIPNSPAAKAGLKEGDILVEISDSPINDLSSYSKALKNIHPGTTVVLKYLREGKEYTVNIDIALR